MKNQSELWSFQSPNSITLSWNSIPFYLKTTIRWRSLLFNIQIKAEKIQYGSMRTISFLYNGKLYHNKLTKWKYTGGGNGIYPPNIKTETHCLNINTGLQYISFTDKFIGGNKFENLKEEFSFEILNAPNEVVFE
jgi:hypothetical protein